MPVDPVAGARCKNIIAGVDKRLCDVGDAVFRSHQSEYSFPASSVTPKRVVYPVRNRTPVRRHSGIGRVVVVLRLLCGLAERCDDVLRCRKIRVAHAKIDDIHAFFLLFGFHLVDPCKKIRREIAHAACVHGRYTFALYSIEITDHHGTLYSVALNQHLIIPQR